MQEPQWRPDMPYTNSELEFMLQDLESDWVERKETFKGEVPETARRTVCAFANDLPNRRKEGGLFVGVTDKGQPADLPITDDLLRNLSDMKTDGKTVPPPSLTVEKRNLLGKDVAVVLVRPSDSPPVRCDGRIWVRVGPRLAVATAQEERILNERRRYLDRPFDARPSTGADMRDLNTRFFEEEYLVAAFSRDVIAANDHSLTERLAALKMIESGEAETPTNLAQLALGNRTRDFIPGSYVQFLRIGGRELSDPILDSADIGGRLDEIINRTEDKMASHNRIAVDLVSGPREIRKQDYPMAALQQLLRNSVMHRAYESTNAPVRVTWFDDRIEIQSPGGPYGAVTVDNFATPGIVDYRNPNVAESLRVLGFVQRFGVGIAAARDQLRRNGNPDPEFIATPSFVSVTVRAKS